MLPFCCSAGFSVLRGYLDALVLEQVSCVPSLGTYRPKSTNDPSADNVKDKWLCILLFNMGVLLHRGTREGVTRRVNAQLVYLCAFQAVIGIFVFLFSIPDHSESGMHVNPSSNKLPPTSTADQDGQSPK